MGMHKREVIYIFILALALRLYFLSGVIEREPFLYGDAFNYDGSAIGIIEMFRNIWPHLGFIAGQAMKGTLGKGMNVLHPLGIHFSIVVFLQGPVYPFFISIVYAIFGHNIHILQYLQAFLSALSCIVLFILSETAFGDRRVSILASLLWALYLPSIYFAELMLTETLGVPILLISLILMTSITNRQRLRAFFLSGIAIAILMLTKHMFRFLWLFISIGLFLSLKDGRLKGVLKKISIFLCGVAILLVPWMSLATLATGRIMSLPSNKDYWRELYVNNDIRYNGWPPDSTFGRTKEICPSPYRRLFFENLIEHPFKSSLLYIEKMRRVWDRFINVRSRTFLIPDSIYIFIHRAFVYLGLFGLVLSLSSWRRHIPFFAVIFYVTCISSILVVEARYNFITMSIMLIFASSFIVNCIDGLKRMYGRVNFKREIIFVLASLAAFLAVRFFSSLPVLFAIFTHLSPKHAYMLKMVIDAASLSFIIPPVYFVFRNSLSTKNLAYMCAVPVIILLIFGTAGELGCRDRYEWRSPLKKGYMVSKIISLPDAAIDPSKVKEVNLLIDMLKPEGADLKVEINKDAYLYSKMAVRDRFVPGIYKDIFRLKSLNPEAIRKWHVLSMLGEHLKSKIIEIKLSLLDHSVLDESHPVIFGNYVAAGDKLYEGPSFARSAEETSFYRLSYEGDYRLPWREILHNDGTKDALYIDGKADARDLSRCVGIQNGEYRIRLEVVQKDGTIKTY